jgi:hypothetical protein
MVRLTERVEGWACPCMRVGNLLLVCEQECAYLGGLTDPFEMSRSLHELSYSCPYCSMGMLTGIIMHPPTHCVLTHDIQAQRLLNVRLAQWGNLPGGSFHTNCPWVAAAGPVA